MDVEIRKQRMHRLVDLARMTHGWSMDQLAGALARTPADVYPESDNPGMDFFMRLAGILEWRVGDVIEVIWGDPQVNGNGRSNGSIEDRWSALYDQWVDMHRHGRQNQDLVRVARDMRLIADTPSRRALTCALEGIGWDALGRYVEAADAFRMGLQITPITASLRRNLQGNLASAMYSLWDLFPAAAMADSLVHWFESNPPDDIPDRKRHAFILYVRGNTHRRMITHHPEQQEAHALQAFDDLSKAAALNRALAEELGEARLAGIAHTCEGGLLEVEVELGRRDATEAIDAFNNRLNEVENPASWAGDWIESFGWWAIFACNVIRRHVQGEARQDAIRTFTCRALNFADIRDNWAIRERAFSIQYAELEKVGQFSTPSQDQPIDHVDQALIAAMISRFPTFRPVGWKILDATHVVQNQ
ncbi:MAG: hypothetical protein KDA21_00030 [Phycisphaerales bacterium]|nr:hypothetical protein [Phycisphaerales bacterium]